MRRAGLIVVVLLAACTGASGQTVFYWNQNYGTESNLLGGLVIGSVDDISATYYNPGYLGLVREPGLILGAKIYEYSDYNIEIDEFTGEGLTSGGLTASPSFIAGSFRIDTAKIHKFYYSFLVRERSVLDFNIKSNELLPDDTQINARFSEVIVQRDLFEGWLGLSWGFSPVEHVGVGLTSYFAIRSDRLRNGDTRSSMADTGTVQTSQVFYEYDYYNVRCLAKLGVFWDLSPFTVGFNVTSPSLSLFGNGNSLLHLTLANEGRADTTTAGGVFVSDYQEDLDARYKNPFSLGLGCSYKIGRSQVHFSVEWFDAIPEYTVLQNQPFVAQSTGDTLSNNTSVALRSVLNFGLGCQIYITEAVSLCGSLMLDHNAADSPNNFDFSGPDMTIYHVTTGSNMRIGSTFLTAGLVFSYGNYPFETGDLWKEAAGERAPGGSDSVLHGRLRQFRVKAILSASFKL